MQDELSTARLAYESGDLDRAMLLIKRQMRWRTDDGRYWELIGTIQYARGRFAVSVSALERASLLVPLTPASRVCLGHGYGKIGRKALSRDLLEILISDSSLSMPLLLQVAAGLDAIDRPDLAMKACRAASERDSQHAQPYYDLGYYAARCGYPPRISESLARKAVSLSPQTISYRIGLMSLLMKQDRYDDACEIIQDLSNEQIDCIHCRCCLQRIARLYEFAGDYRRTTLCRQKLLTLELSSNESSCG